MLTKMHNPTKPNSGRSVKYAECAARPAIDLPKNCLPASYSENTHWKLPWPTPIMGLARNMSQPTSHVYSRSAPVPVSRFWSLVLDAISLQYLSGAARSMKPISKKTRNAERTLRDDCAQQKAPTAAIPRNPPRERVVMAARIYRHNSPAKVIFFTLFEAQKSPKYAKGITMFNCMQKSFSSPNQPPTPFPPFSVPMIARNT